ncbi:hypothetical protein BEN49_05700 [Hymenobacter coccineus]|uniref:Uncharacterized protein n=1 Tax=Hymenobacter coccineus TaxID=1908235 RepID=A0A1G1TJC1_9BACT|nr:hypothetical protein BEN49_05700 [Hymenobacter coccineus]
MTGVPASLQQTGTQLLARFKALTTTEKVLSGLLLVFVVRHFTRALAAPPARSPPFLLPTAMHKLPQLPALLAGLLVSACNASPVATTAVASLPPAVTAKPTAADSAAAPASAASVQSVPFVGKPGLKAVLRSGGLAPATH